MESLNEHYIVKEVRDAQALISAHKRAIQNLCLNTDYDINERFELWSDFVDKIHHSYWFHFCMKDEKPGRAGGYSKIPVPELLKNWDERVEERYSYHSWDDIYDSIIDHYCYNWSEHKYDEDQLTDPKIREVKEWFIKENFGGFTADW